MFFDGSEVKDDTDFPLIKPGEYVAMIRTATKRENRNRNGFHISVHFVLRDGGRGIYHNYNIGSDNPEAMAIGKSEFKKLLKAAIGIESLKSENDLINLENRHVLLKIGEKEKYNDPGKFENTVKGAKPLPADQQPDLLANVSNAATRPSNLDDIPF